MLYSIVYMLSTVADLLSGVIQGSVIGPLMFLVYINDLVTLLKRYNVRIKLFADDVQLYAKVGSQEDISELQTALTALVSWAEMRRLNNSEVWFSCNQVII